jgi:hypothetical protein
MDSAELKSFGKPDEVRDFSKRRLELVKIGGATIDAWGVGEEPAVVVDFQGMIDYAKLT